MTAVRLALTELRRIGASRVGRLALVAMVLVPSIYGGLYLYANHDPYGRLSQVPAALVVEDEGATLATGEHLAVGDDVASSLLAAGTFDWTRTDRVSAERGLADGEFDLVLALPAGFSADLASTAGAHPRQATLEVETDDANGYLARTIADTLVDQVTASVAEQVSRTAASRFLEGFADIHAEVTDAAGGARELAAGAGSAASGAHDLDAGADRLVAGQRRLVDGTDRLAAGVTDLSAGLDDLRSSTSDLPDQTARLADGAHQVAEGNARAAAAGREVAGAAGALVGDLTAEQGRLAKQLRAAGFTEAEVGVVLDRVAGLSGPVADANASVQAGADDLQRLSAGAQAVADGADRLAAAAPELAAGISRAAGAGTSLTVGADDLATGQRSARSGAEQLAAGAHRLDDGLARVAGGAGHLAAGLDEGARTIPETSLAERRALAATIASPVTVSRDADAPAGSYGAGLAPFFMSLALWIGGFVLFTRMRALSARALAAGQPAWRISLGGWLAPAVLGVAQAVVAYAVVSLGVGIDVAHPVALLAFMALVSMTFVAMIHALMTRLGVVGQFVALVLMVVQLVSAGGTFPWQTLPGPLHPLHRVLPMSYAVDGVRRLMYGGSPAPLGTDLLALGAWLLVAAVFSSWATRRAARWSARRVKPELAV